MALAHPRRQSAVPEAARGATPVLATTSATWGEEDPHASSRRAATTARPRSSAGCRRCRSSRPTGSSPTCRWRRRARPRPCPPPRSWCSPPPTPRRAMLADLADAAGSDPVPLADVEDATALASGAVQARIYALMAGFCLVVALLVLAASVSPGARRARPRGGGAARGRRPARPRCAARPGARSARSRSPPSWPPSWAGCVGVAAAAEQPDAGHGPAARRTARASASRCCRSPLAAVVAALLVLVVGGRSRSVGGETSRPAILREEV